MVGTFSLGPISCRGPAGGGTLTSKARGRRNRVGCRGSLARKSIASGREAMESYDVFSANSARNVSMAPRKARL